MPRIQSTCCFHAEEILALTTGYISFDVSLNSGGEKNGESGLLGPSFLCVQADFTAIFAGLPLASAGQAMRSLG